MISCEKSCVASYGANEVATQWELTLAVGVGEYSDFKDFSNFLPQDIIEFKKIFNAVIFRIYEGELRNFENLHFVVPWHPPWYRK